MQIVVANISDLSIIKDLAYQIWPHTYGSILSKQQLDYMLEQFYSIKNLENNLTQLNHQFYLVKEENQFVGFFSTEINYNNKPTTRIHKIYLKPETQGKGFGSKVINFVEQLALQHNNSSINLNVNRYNKALHFYIKLGFEIILQEDIRLDHGYLMEDYLMEKTIKS